MKYTLLIAALFVGSAFAEGDISPEVLTEIEEVTNEVTPETVGVTADLAAFKYETAKKSVVIVRHINKKDKGYATGFMVREDLILTNHHTIKKQHRMRTMMGWMTVDLGLHNYLLVEDHEGNQSLGKVLKFHEGNDWALLKLIDSDLVSKPVTLSEKPVQRQEKVSLVGHPQQFHFTHSIGSVAHIGAELLHIGGKRFLLQTLASFGSSGSPVFRESDGTVLGMLAEITRGGNGALIVPVETFKDEIPQEEE